MAKEDSVDYSEVLLELREKEQISIALCKLIFKFSLSFKKKISKVRKTDKYRTVCQYNPTWAPVYHSKTQQHTCFIYRKIVYSLEGKARLSLPPLGQALQVLFLEELSQL